MNLRSIKELMRQRETARKFLQRPPRQTDTPEEAETEAFIQKIVRENLANLEAEIAERTGATIQPTDDHSP